MAFNMCCLLQHKSTISKILEEFSTQLCKTVFHLGNSKASDLTFCQEHQTIVPSRVLKYIGFWLDECRNLELQVQKTKGKAEKSLTALMKIKPNVEGPFYRNRTDLCRVVQSIGRVSAVIKKNLPKILSFFSQYYYIFYYNLFSYFC